METIQKIEQWLNRPILIVLLCIGGGLGAVALVWLTIILFVAAKNPEFPYQAQAQSAAIQSLIIACVNGFLYWFIWMKKEWAIFGMIGILCLQALSLPAPTHHWTMLVYFCWLSLHLAAIGRIRLGLDRRFYEQ